jgi:hypothetical protein
MTIKVSDHQHVAPTSATIAVKRGTWTKGEGSYNCNSGFSSSNTTQWGDISGVSASEATISVTNSANATKTVDVTTSVRAYFNAKTSTIVFVLDATSGYTEFWSRDQGSSKPTLTIEYETNTRPSAPTLGSPAASSIVTGTKPTFTWTHHDAQNDAQASAQIEVSTSTGTVVGTNTVTGTAGTYTWPTDLTRGTAYRFRVVTSDAGGAGTWSGYQAFSIASLPAAPAFASPTPSEGSTVTSQRPSFGWTHSQANGYAQSSAEVEVSTSAGVVVSTQTVTGTAGTLTWPSDLTRGSSYRVRVRTASSSVGFGPWGAYRSFVIAALVVVTITEKKLEWNATLGRPVVRVTWSNALPSGRTQKKFRVTWSGYDSGWVTSALTYAVPSAYVPVDNTTLTITVQIEDSLALLSTVVSTTFKTRFGMAVYKKDLGKVPVAWGTPSVTATVPSGSSVNIQYGTNTASAATAPTAWYSALSAAPKAQYLFYRVWLLPTPGGASPSLDKIVVPFTDTKPALDFWYGDQNHVAMDARVWSIDESDYVYGSRTITGECGASVSTVCSYPIPLRAGRTYILSGLMRGEGTPGAVFRLVKAGDLSQLLDAQGAAITSPLLNETKDWIDPSTEDVIRYRTPTFTAPSDMDVRVQLRVGAGVGSQAWFDALKVEESTVATPWQPGQLGAAVLDAGGVQIDGVKGGVFRIRGSEGNPLDVVQGGSRGLIIGETELFGPQRGLIQARDRITWPGSYAAGGVVVSSGWRSGPNNDGSSSGRFTKISGGVLRGQYHIANAVFLVSSIGGAGNGADTAIVQFSAVQQQALGSAPGVHVKVLGQGWWPSDFTCVYNVYPTYTEWSLWVKNVRTWAPIGITPLAMHSAETVNFDNPLNAQSVTALPAGTQVVGVSWEGTSDAKAIGIQVAKTSTQSAPGAMVGTKVTSWNLTQRAAYGVAWSPSGYSDSIQILREGFYLVSASARFLSIPAGTRALISLWTNTAAAPTALTLSYLQTESSNQQTTAQNVYVAGSWLVPFSVNGGVALAVAHSAAGAVNVDQCMLAVARMGT